MAYPGFWSYPGKYLSQHPTTDRIAETIFKLEEDVLQAEQYPVERQAEVRFGEPIDAGQFLEQEHVNAKTGVRPMTRLLKLRIKELVDQMGAGSTPEHHPNKEPTS